MAEKNEEDRLRTAESNNNGDGSTTTSSSIATTTMVPVVTLDDVNKGKPIRLQVKVMVPVHDHPNFNFVGKLLGPKGNSLKWLQDQTQTKMAILGRGSMRNKDKETELRALNDVKYSHLNEDLHVEITAYAHAAEAYSRIGRALFEIKRFLVPDYYDDIRQQQLRELGVLKDVPPYGSDLSSHTIPPIGLFVSENANMANESSPPSASLAVIKDLSSQSPFPCLAASRGQQPTPKLSSLDVYCPPLTERRSSYKSKHRSADDYYQHGVAMLPPFKRKP